MKELRKLYPSKISIIRSQPAILINHSEPIAAPVSVEKGNNNIKIKIAVHQKLRLRN